MHMHQYPKRLLTVNVKPAQAFEHQRRFDSCPKSWFRHVQAETGWNLLRFWRPYLMINFCRVEVKMREGNTL